jgi:signal transduction histidine kinase/CheY-like chemotaxis protein/HPt (histidine-containing phosphotransfer) domain-containing protein
MNILKADDGMSAGTKLPFEEQSAGHLATAANRAEAGSAMGMAMGELDLAIGLVRLGPAFSKMLGDDPSFWAEKPLEQLLARCHPDDRINALDLLGRVKTAGEKNVHLELRFMNKEDFWVTLLARGQVVSRQGSPNSSQIGPQPSHISFVFIDVTELRERDSRWRHRAELASEWFWSTDANGLLSEVSEGIAVLIGCGVSDLLGKPLVAILAAAGVKDSNSHQMLFVSERKELRGCLLRLEQTNAVPAWVELEATPRYSYRGVYLGHEGIARNVTSRHMQDLALLEAMQAAEHSNKSKSAFLAAMSHEIRTPMNGVLGMAEMLSTTDLDDDQSESLGIIRKSATHLLSLIDGILDFSKLEAGKVEMEERAVFVDDVLFNLTASLLPIAHSKNVRLRAFTDPDLPPLTLDDTRLRQVLTNLIGNALKFSATESGSTGDVAVRAFSDGEGHLKITVADNGIGISPVHLRSVFDAFNQAEVSTTRRFGGTGLGLAIAQKLVQLMGGQIEVESELGKGTTFTLFIPMKPAGEKTEFPGVLSERHCVIVGPDTLENQDLKLAMLSAKATVHLVPDASSAYAFLNSVKRPTVFLHNPILMSEGSYASALSRYTWPIGVTHLLLTDGTRKSLRMLEERVACVDWSRSSALVNAVLLLSEDRSQIPDAAAASKKRLVGLNVAPSIKKLSSKIRVLVAEDDPINRKVISKQLSHLGVQGTFASTGREALDIWLKDKGYSMILTDLHMPEMDGYELTRRVRGIERESDNDEHIPIVALTANAVTGETFEAYKAGIDLYLTKPILLADLSVAIATFALEGVEPKVSGEKRQTPILTPAIPAQPHFDLATLTAILGDDFETLCDLSRSFIDDLTLALPELLASLVNNDAKSYRFLAHRFKSSSKSVGALNLTAVFVQIEGLETIGSNADGLEAYSQLESAFDAYQVDVKISLKALEEQNNDK